MTNYDSEYSKSLNPDEPVTNLDLNKDTTAPAAGYYGEAQPQATPQYGPPAGAEPTPQYAPPVYGPPSAAPAPMYNQPVANTNPYNTPQPQGYNGYPVAAVNNKNAVMSIIFSGVGLVVGLFTGFLMLLSIPGVIFGHKALKELRTSQEAGHGLAIAGLVMGYVSIALMAVLAVIVFLILGIGVLASGSGY
jgi:hypothetical protein